MYEEKVRRIRSVTRIQYVRWLFINDMMGWWAWPPVPIRARWSECAALVNGWGYRRRVFEEVTIVFDAWRGEAYDFHSIFAIMLQVWHHSAIQRRHIRCMRDLYGFWCCDFFDGESIQFCTFSKCKKILCPANYRPPQKLKRWAAVYNTFHYDFLYTPFIIYLPLRPHSTHSRRSLSWFWPSCRLPAPHPTNRFSISTN